MQAQQKEDSTRIVLSKRRKERGSQRKVAFDLGITELHLRKIEKGRGDPGVKLMFRMGRYFGECVYLLFPDLADQECFCIKMDIYNTYTL